MAREVELYVAVCDNEQTYAGEDGGPAKGGKGRWRVGEVGPWTAEGKPNLAIRDPEDGLIWKGWLERVTAFTQDANGGYIVLGQEPIFEPRPDPDQRSAPKPKVRERVTSPTPAALRRAAQGGAPIAAVMKGATAQQPTAAEALGGTSARAKAKASSGRAVDAPVG